MTSIFSLKKLFVCIEFFEVLIFTPKRNMFRLKTILCVKALCLSAKIVKATQDGTLDQQQTAPQVPGKTATRRRDRQVAHVTKRRSSTPTTVKELVESASDWEEDSSVSVAGSEVCEFNARGSFTRCMGESHARREFQFSSKTNPSPIRKRATTSSNKTKATSRTNNNSWRSTS